ncbi:SIMPL domain-containing protein [Oceanicella actignis]|uniref:SIMPL domain-containing protein n=1 Tax=Oceanicella actignis TaxID=1189325 RepID=UPI0012563891|nr:SIMPL domain-containing protein [Oceanicella actignis]TYO90894.1 hypothetical protein LY05_01029 [Oceanicella actignis]
MSSPRRSLVPFSAALGGLAVSAALALAAPAAAEPAMRSVSAEGVGVVSLAPDRASIMIGVEEMRDTAAEAMEAVSAAAAGVIAALRHVGVPAADIATMDISLGPVMRRAPAADEPARVVGYRARNMLRVNVTDLSRLGQAVGAAAAAGGNAISSVAFDSSEAEDARRRALALAVEDARRRAEIMAASAGARLGPVQELSESGEPRPMMRMQAAMADGAAPVMPGERTLSVRVHGRWALVD